MSALENDSEIEPAPPAKVRGYIVHANARQWFYWWCRHGQHWHVNGWDPDSLLRNAPRCLRKAVPCREIEHDPIGVADWNVLRRIENQEAPPAEPDEGKPVDADGIYRLLCEHTQAIAKGILTRSRSDQIIGEYGRAILLAAHWVMLRDKRGVGPDRIRDRDLYDAVEQDLPKRKISMGDLIADPESPSHDAAPGQAAISSTTIRLMLAEGLTAIEALIEEQADLGLIAWSLEVESHKLRVWRAMSRRGTTPISAAHFREALKCMTDDGMDLRQAVAAAAYSEMF